MSFVPDLRGAECYNGPIGEDDYRGKDVSQVEMANVQITVPKDMAPFIATSDSTKMTRQNAMLLYPYIQDRTLTPVRAAEILGVNIVDLTELYNSMGLPNFGASPSGTEPMFRELVDGILSFMREQVASIILYGSAARGTSTPDSDIDIALILRDKLNKETHSRLLDLIVDLNLKYDKLFSVANIDEDFFMKWKDAIPFYGNVEKEGIVLWKAA